MEEESPPTPLGKGGEEAARASLTVAAPLGKGGEEGAQYLKSEIASLRPQ
jgi:hypothetical protein